jgi:hypothetical protein
MQKSTKKIGGGLAMTLCLAVASFAAPKSQTFTGEILDSQCAKNGSHAMMLKEHGMGDKANGPAAKKKCTEDCVKMGGKYVLYNPATKKVYQLDDQTKPQRFAGENVKVTGALDKASGTIHITNIE